MLYHILRFFIKLIGHLPFCVLYALSDAIYYVFYHVVRYRRGIVRKNLTESFAGLSPAEVVQIEKHFYHSFIDVALESTKLLTLTEAEMKRRMRFVGIEKVNNELAAGQSVALYLGHFGNWEWISSLGLWITVDATQAQIYHQLRNPSINRLMREMRERMGHNACVDMYDTVRFMVNAARSARPAIIGFIADQSPKRREAKHFINFLHHQTPVLTGTEKTTKHFAYQPYFVQVKRTARGFYEAQFVSLLHEGETVKQVPDFELTHRYFTLLQAEITQHPELYLWTHNRFKYCK